MQPSAVTERNRPIEYPCSKDMPGELTGRDGQRKRQVRPGGRERVGARRPWAEGQGAGSGCVSETNALAAGELVAPFKDERAATGESSPAPMYTVRRLPVGPR